MDDWEDLLREDNEFNFMDCDSDSGKKEVEIKEHVNKIDPLVDLKTIKKKYRLILMDPPWKYKIQKKNGCTDKHYETMTMNEIKNLPISNLADQGCVLLIWVTNPFLSEALKLIEHWGFEYKTVFFVWNKININNGKPKYGTGSYSRPSTELCLIARKKGTLKDIKSGKTIHQFIQSIPREFSRKPEEAYQRIDEFFIPTLSKIELFAREERPGYDSWGFETKKFSNTKN